MKFFTNKHVIVAMVVAPILAVLSWLLVDNWVGEKPHSAVKGAAYPLVAKSNCRYSSGACDLYNNDLELRLQIENKTDSATITISSSHALQTATIGLVDADVNHEELIRLTPTNVEQTHWQMDFPIEFINREQARIVVRAQDSYYYTETGLAFSDYQTIFNKDFRKTSN